MAPVDNGDRFITWRIYDEQTKMLRDENLTIRKEILEEVRANASRIDRIESTLDQLRGAKAVLYIIFGTSITSLMLAGITLYQLVTHEG
jgi:uncharacterized protein YacL (UPF0231 family)